MPHGIRLRFPKRIYSSKHARIVDPSKLSFGVSVTSSGIMYSNIDPDQDVSTDLPWRASGGRPSLNQWRRGMSPFAIATKLASRASDVSRNNFHPVCLHPSSNRSIEVDGPCPAGTKNPSLSQENLPHPQLREAAALIPLFDVGLSAEITDSV